MTKPPRKATSASPPLSPSSPMVKPAPRKPAATPGKLDQMVQLLQRPEGASLAELVEATGWQKHSVRGALAAGIPKKIGRKVISEKLIGLRRYRLPHEEAQ